MDASIQVESLVVEYRTASGPVRALDEVSLTVDAGSSVAITGPSGCGKSTLLGVLGGLAVPSSGVVRIGGEELSSLPERRRSGFSEQRHHATGVLSRVWTLRVALNEPARLKPKEAGMAKPWRCRLRIHRWQRLRNPPGGWYRECLECGKQDDTSSRGGPNTFGSP